MATENIEEILEQYFPQLIEKELKEEIIKLGKLEMVKSGEILIDLDEVIGLLIHHHPLAE